MEVRRRTTGSTPTSNLPYAYVYPRQMRPTRDLLRRRLFFARKRGELLAHIQNTNTQYNLPPLEERPDKTKDRGAVIEHFEDNTLQMTIAVDVALLDADDQVIRELELYLLHEVRQDHNRDFFLLRSIPGIGEILSQTLVYEIHRACTVALWRLSLDRCLVQTVSAPL